MKNPLYKRAFPFLHLQSRASLTIPRFHLYEERIYLPFTDPEATLTFYLVGPKEIFNKLPELEKHLHEVNWVHYRSEDFDVG